MKILRLLLLLAAFLGGTATPVFNLHGFGPAIAYGQGNNDQGQDNDDQGEDNDDQGEDNDDQ
jgi:hypothetical protein